jgi:transforming growth factor-beta-induced protein
MSTVFASTNVTFDADLPSGALNYLLQSENVNMLSQLVSYHIISAMVVRSTDLTDGLVVENKAFEELPDGRFMVNGVATIDPADLEASNGIMHIINKVLIPPDFPPFPHNLLEKAEEAGFFSILLEAIQVTGFSNTFTNGRILTVFAPYDVAFSKLPVGSLTFLLRNPSNLAQILSYHVSAEVVDLESLANGQPEQKTISTLLDEQELELTTENDGNGVRLLVNGLASIVLIGNTALNGVLQTIDTLLIPPGVEVTPSIGDVVSEMDEFQSLLDTGEAVMFDLTALHAPGPFST